MLRSFLSITASLSLVLSSPAAFAEQIVPVKIPTATTSTAATNDRGVSAVQGQTQSAGSSNINQGAGEGKKSQLAGMASNLASAAMMVAMAQTMQEGNPMKYVMYGMAALSAAQGAMLGADAGKSAATEQASQYNPASTNYDGGAYIDPGSTYTPDMNGSITDMASKNPAGAKAIEALKDAGYTLDKNGLTDPSGKTTPLSAFSSPSAMSAAGITQDVIDKVKAIGEKVSGDASNRVISMGVDGGAGGGSRSPSSDDDDASMRTWIWPNMKNPFAKSKEDQRNLVAGKSVTLNGEPIGVAADNIFQKISKHYNNKKQLKEFID